MASSRWSLRGRLALGGARHCRAWGCCGCGGRSRHAERTRIRRFIRNRCITAWRAYWMQESVWRAAFEKALELTHNISCAFGLVRAYARWRKVQGGGRHGALLFVASIGRGIEIMERAKATGKRLRRAIRRCAAAELRARAAGAFRPHGGSRTMRRPWMCATPRGRPYRWRSIAGRTCCCVYLGPECPHCSRQLHEIAKTRMMGADEYGVLAVSSAGPEKNGDLPMRLLSDADHANARRFHS